MSVLKSGAMGIVMKPLIFALCVFSAFGGLSAQTPGWQPSPGHTQVPIWPGLVPGAQPAAGPEDMKSVEDPLVAGKPWVEIENVS
jgi:hypothetical protein